MTSDPTKLKLTKEFNLPGIAFCVARVPNSGRLIFGSSDFKLYDVDALAEKPQPTPFNGEGHQSYVTGVVLATPNTAVSGSYDGKLMWWNLENKEPTRTVAAHEMWIRRLAVSPDGKTIASVADDMQCKLWNAETGEGDLGNHVRHEGRFGRSAGALHLGSASAASLNRRHSVAGVFARHQTAGGRRHRPDREHRPSRSERSD